MNKNILTAFGIAILLNGNAQKLQLTEAATEYKNNFSKAWMMQPDQLESNKSVLGSFSATIFFGGRDGSSDQTATEEFTGETTALNLKTITDS